VRAFKKIKINCNRAWKESGGGGTGASPQERFEGWEPLGWQVVSLRCGWWWARVSF